MKKERRSSILTGIAGVHHVVEVLSRRGVVALPTIRNTAAYDIIAVSEDGARHANIQVKTTRGRKFWLMPRPEKIRTGPKDFYVLLRLVEKEKPSRYAGYMLTGKDALRYVKMRWSQLSRSRTTKSWKKFASVHVDGRYEKPSHGWAQRWETWKI